MSVFVDRAFIPASVPHRGRTVTSLWCHMAADTREELDEMADRIGLRRSWIQHPGTWKEHYDVTEPRRKSAVREGAIEVDRLTIVKQRAEQLLDQQLVANRVETQ